ncbi:hypothetical protein [Olsenella massiliensis]|uniref:hypothetical protein n=1 Tax=Olsenella massiliensis TaxID=1622075 RepID=UPI000AEFA0C9|nr:hypothetical protein [Olsenella massiliensis]
MDTMVPYFMTNPDWYTVIGLGKAFPDDGRGYHLTDSAPEDAVKSYEDYYSIVESDIQISGLNERSRLGETL